MKRVFRLIALSVVILTIAVVTCVGVVWASSGPMGSAPNSGDGIPDGSGFDVTNGPNGDVGAGSGPVGPAPNSGDGIPDGSGF